MELLQLEKNKENTKLSFLVKDATPAFMNTLRRAIISFVPTMSIEEVEFKDNSSILYDEMVAHRLGLIPLTTDLKSYELPPAEGLGETPAAKHAVQLSLKAKGPKVVYASELKSKDPAINPVHAKMPIVKLNENQKIELVATACLGIGKDHAKWSPGIAYYKNKPLIKELASAKHKESLDVCPKGMVEVSKGKVQVNKEFINEGDWFGTFIEKELDKVVEITPIDGEYIFYVESFGQLKCKEMVVKACEILSGKFDQFAEEVKKL